MQQFIAFALLFGALVFPVIGVVMVRILAPRLSNRIIVMLIGSVFAAAAMSVLVLAGSDIPRLQVGDLYLMLPVAHSDSNNGPPVQPNPVVMIPPTPEPPLTPTLTLTPPTLTFTAEPESTTTPTPEVTTQATVVQTATATLAPTSPPEPTEAPASPPEPTAPVTQPTQIVYVVEEGDTLNSIANKFNVTARDILRANNFSGGDSLKIGQELIIPPPNSGAAPEATAAPARRTYIVKEGDTLGGIAEKFGMSSRDLMRVNDIDDPSSLQIGQELIIP